MKKVLIPIFSALILGFLCALYVISQYNKEDALALEDNIYFLQIAAYNNLESSKDDFKNIENKLIIKEDNKYYTYIGITSNLKQAKRIKKLYQENNIEVYIKEKRVYNDDFITELKQYDVLIENSKSFEEINSVLKTILATYEENVLNS